MSWAQTFNPWVKPQITVPTSTSVSVLKCSYSNQSCWAVLFLCCCLHTVEGHYILSRVCRWNFSWLQGRSQYEANLGTCLSLFFCFFVLLNTLNTQEENLTMDIASVIIFSGYGHGLVFVLCCFTYELQNCASVKILWFYSSGLHLSD